MKSTPDRRREGGGEQRVHRQRQLPVERGRGKVRREFFAISFIQKKFREFFAISFIQKKFRDFFCEIVRISTSKKFEKNRQFLPPKIIYKT
jgi:hypothetical protein